MFNFVKNMTAAAVLAVGLISGGAASAVPVDFSFTNAPNTLVGNTATYTVSGLGLTITGSGNLIQGGGGIGINGRIFAGESLTFTFSEFVSLASVTMREFLAGVDTVTVAGGGASQTFSTVDNATTNDITNTLSIPLVGTSFTFTMDSATGTGLDAGVLVRGLSASVIPLPAAGFLLLVGLGGLAATRRRRSA